KIFELIKSNTEGWLFSKLLLSLGASASILWSIYFSAVTISIPYQIEFREGAAQVMTGFLLNRNNPFILENQPLAMNNYGLGYNVVVAPFAALFGNTLWIHRSVTFVFILLSSLAGFFVIHKIKGNLASGLACAAFIMIGLIGRGGIGAFPSAMGTFLFMLAVLIPFLKAFTPTSLLLSVLFSIAAFYSKAYFVLGFCMVASYLFLFVSKKTGLFYGVLFLMLFAISFFAMRLAFPLYFLDVIIGNISNASRSAAHLFSQLIQLLIYFFPILFASLLMLEKGTFNRAGVRTFNLGIWKQPLIGASPDYFFYSFVCALLVFILFLGPHVGSYLTYAYQLVIPVFFCWFFLKFDPQKKMGFLIAVLVIFNLFFWERSVIPPQMLEQKNSKAWASLYSYVRSSSNLLNSPVITSAAIEFGLTPLDSGQTAYFYAIGPYPDNIIFGPFYDTFHADGFRYIKFIDNSIEKQKFDLVFTTREKGAFYHMKLLEMFYTPVAELRVDMPQTEQQWTVVIWKPLVR
ncbi:MAG TPA: hypothetical protein VK206_24790, partial [Anaerolineales bacterium]|nr:hypothetical protein [Anaerolineales bacterium]